jgi:tripartite ATP-independent transporter DctM subunit
VVAAARRVALLAVLGMLIIAVATSLDITLRALFRAPILGFLEIASLLMAVTIAACFPAGCAERQHITIDLLKGALGPRVSAVLEALGSLLFLLFLAVLAWRMAGHAAAATAEGSLTGTLKVMTGPFWWTTALFLLLAVPAQLVVLLADVRAALTGSAAARPAAEATDGGRMRLLTPVLAYGSFAVCLAYMAWAVADRSGAMASLAGDRALLALVISSVMWALTMLLTPLGSAMGLSGIVGIAIVVGLDPALNAFGTQSADLFHNFNIAVIPLFLMMGSFAAAAGLGTDVYRLASAVVGHLRGGIAMATIGGCAAFGSVSGSSVATIAGLGRIAMDEMRRRRYSAQLSTGSIAAGGTLGALVPPSGVMVLYAILTETSIGHMFIGALVPAALAVIGYIAAIWVVVRLRPDAGPAGKRASAAELFSAARGSWAVFALFGLVVGGIYLGAFTPTEAGAVGAGGAFLVALSRGRLSGVAFWQVMGETASTTAMIYMLILGGMTFSFFIGLTQLPDALVDWVERLEISPLSVILFLLLVYVVLGTAMDPFAIMIVTVPVVTPMVVGLGFDPIWWGVINVMVVEIGVLTPPVGMNLFVMKNIAPEVPLNTVYWGVMPFVVSSIVKLLLLTFFPILVLWLPRTMG